MRKIVWIDGWARKLARKLSGDGFAHHQGAGSLQLRDDRGILGRTISHKCGGAILGWHVARIDDVFDTNRDAREWKLFRARGNGG